MTDKKFLILAGILCLAACQPKAPAHDWSGKWLGPEGTYLSLSQNLRGTYDVAIRNLDGERVFNATSDKDGVLTFTRDGVTETIRPGTGKETGMKWLTDKHDCLIVKPGEGYCRD